MKRRAADNKRGGKNKEQRKGKVCGAFLDLVLENCRNAFLCNWTQKKSTLERGLEGYNC
jgi:hypothetical protein